jgi:hypothetical protein
MKQVLEYQRLEPVLSAKNGLMTPIFSKNSKNLQNSVDIPPIF